MERVDVIRREETRPHKKIQKEPLLSIIGEEESRLHKNMHIIMTFGKEDMRMHDKEKSYSYGDEGREAAERHDHKNSKPHRLMFWNSNSEAVVSHRRAGKDL